MLVISLLPLLFVSVLAGQNNRDGPNNNHGSGGSRRKDGNGGVDNNSTSTTNEASSVQVASLPLADVVPPVQAAAERSAPVITSLATMETSVPRPISGGSTNGTDQTNGTAQTNSSSVAINPSVAPFAVPFRLPGDPTDVLTFSSPPAAQPLSGNTVDLNNLPSDPLVVKDFFCSGMYSIRGLNAPLAAVPDPAQGASSGGPTQADVDAYFIAAANQFRTISGLPPLTYNPCLSLNGFATAVAALSSSDPGAHAGFGAVLAGQTACTVSSRAEGLLGTQNYMPWWARIQAGMCLLMGDAGHRDPFMNPSYSQIGYNYFPKGGDLKATEITFRVEYA